MRSITRVICLVILFAGGGGASVTEFKRDIKHRRLNVGSVSDDGRLTGELVVRVDDDTDFSWKLEKKNYIYIEFLDQMMIMSKMSRERRKREKE